MSIYEEAEAAHERRAIIESLGFNIHAVADAALTLVAKLRIHTQWPKEKWRIEDQALIAGSRVKVKIDGDSLHNALATTATVVVGYTVDGERWFKLTFVVKREQRDRGADWWTVEDAYDGSICFVDQDSMDRFYFNVSANMIHEVQHFDAADDAS